MKLILTLIFALSSYLIYAQEDAAAPSNQNKIAVTIGDYFDNGLEMINLIADGCR